MPEPAQDTPHEDGGFARASKPRMMNSDHTHTAKQMSHAITRGITQAAGLNVSMKSFRRKKSASRPSPDAPSNPTTQEKNPAKSPIAAAVENNPQPIDITVKLTAPATDRSEEHTSELQSLMRISYAVFCLKKQKNT